MVVNSFLTVSLLFLSSLYFLLCFCFKSDFRVNSMAPFGFPSVPVGSSSLTTLSGKAAKLRRTRKRFRAFRLESDGEGQWLLTAVAVAFTAPAKGRRSSVANPRSGLQIPLLTSFPLFRSCLTRRAIRSTAGSCRKGWNERHQKLFAGRQKLFVVAPLCPHFVVAPLPFAAKGQTGKEKSRVRGGLFRHPKPSVSGWFYLYNFEIGV